MKIALTGSHCTGKTTTGNDLARLLKLPMKKEIARNYNVNTIDMDEYAWIERQIMKDQIKAEEVCNGIFDRTVYDQLAYARFKLRYTHPAVVSMLEAQVIAHRNTFDLIIYMPPVLPIVDDGFRCMKFQKEIDTELKTIYKEFNVPIYTLKSINRYARVSEILNVLIGLGLIK